MRLRAFVTLGASVLVLTGCADHRASLEAKDLARERAIDIGNELAAGVFVDGPDGVESGLGRARFGVDRADIVANTQAATVSAWLTHTVFIEGGSFSPQVEESAVICVEYTVDLEGGDTVIREADCPDEIPTGEHVVVASLGGDVQIDSHDAMRALNRFQLPPNGHINEYRLTAEAKEALPDAIAALEPLSEQDVVVSHDIVDALTQAGVGIAVRTDALPGGVRFGATVGSGCIYGTVGPGVFDVEAGGYPSDGGPCIGGDYR